MFGIKFRINQIAIHFEHLFHYPQKVVDNNFVTIEDALFFRANFGKTETFRSVLKTFPHVSDDSHYGKRGSTFRKTTLLLLIHFLTTSSAVMVFRQKNVKWHIDDKIEHFDIYRRYILKIYWWYSERFDQTGVTSGPDYGCACLIDLTELYLNSKKSVTRKLSPGKIK